MKKFVSILAVLLSPLLSAGQSRNPQPAYDTVQVYKCTYTIIRDGDATFYKIDGKSVTKEEFEKVKKGFLAQKKCNPCFLQRLRLDGSVDSQGVFYYTCPGSDEKNEHRTQGKDSEQIYIRSNSCDDGEWSFYSRDGKLEETKYFDHGQELKSKSRLVD